MAGFWIKMRVDLNSDPAVIAIAARMGMDEFAVVGRLHHVWSWADAQTVDGNAVGVTRTWLDRYVSAPGFADSMISAGWLAQSDKGLSIPNFDRHNGETAKRRSVIAKRVAKFRNRSNAPRNAGSVTECVPKGDERTEGKPPSEVSEEYTLLTGLDPPFDDGDAVMEFPCAGHGPAKWILTSRKLAEYQTSFPAADVENECRAARQWCIDNPKKRKTASGMPRFLTSWLSKVQNSGGKNGSTWRNPQATNDPSKLRGDDHGEYDFSARHGSA